MDGIIVWGTAIQYKLHEIWENEQHCAHNWNKKFFHVTHLYKKIEFTEVK